jgi:hypothetical protein
MRNYTLHVLAAGTLASLAALGTAGVWAQQNSDGGDYRPLTLNSPARPEVQRGAVEAARAHGGAGSEGTGTSMAPAPTSAMTNSDEIQQGAVSAARAHGGAGSEAPGSSMAPSSTGSGG